MSHLHTTLRMGLLIKEFPGRGVNSPVRVVVGDPIPRADLAPLSGDPTAMMAFLRERTYALSPTPLDPKRHAGSSSRTIIADRSEGCGAFGGGRRLIDRY